MSFSRPARFCPYCAHRLIRRDDHGVRRPTCPACGFIAYRNPSPAVAVVLPREDGIALELLRAEVGARIEVGELIGAYPGTDDPRVRVVLLVYRARAVGGRLRAGDDASEIGVFGVDALPADVAFRAHRAAIRDYRRALLAESSRAVRKPRPASAREMPGGSRAAAARRRSRT